MLWELNKNSLIQLIEDLNYEMFEKFGDDGNDHIGFSFSTDGNVYSIEFIGYQVWCSEDEECFESFKEDNPDSPIETEREFVVSQIQKNIKPVIDRLQFINQLPLNIGVEDAEIPEEVATAN